MPNSWAPQGKMYVCRDCGRRSKDLWGTKPVNEGWDASCVLFAVLLEEKQLVINSKNLVINANLVYGG